MRTGTITPEQAIGLADAMGNSSYGAYLRQAATDFLSAS
jgi:hypothetical protein